MHGLSGVAAQAPERVWQAEDGAQATLSEDDLSRCLLPPPILLLPAEQLFQFFVTEQGLELSKLLLYRHAWIKPFQQLRGRQVGGHIVRSDVHHFKAEPVLFNAEPASGCQIASIDITTC